MGKRQITIRLEDEIAKSYEEMAGAKGISLTTFIQDILVGNLHTVSLTNEVTRIEDVLDSFERIEDSVIEKEYNKIDEVNKTVTLVWSFDGRQVARQSLDVGRSPHWRTWGFLPRRAAGHTVEVTVLDASGATLHADRLATR